jgi:hypothetical protein
MECIGATEVADSGPNRKPLSASMAYSLPLPQPPAVVSSDTLPMLNRGELERERAHEGLGKLIQISFGYWHSLIAMGRQILDD